MTGRTDGTQPSSDCEPTIAQEVDVHGAIDLESLAGERQGVDDITGLAFPQAAVKIHFSDNQKLVIDEHEWRRVGTSGAHHWREVDVVEGQTRYRVRINIDGDPDTSTYSILVRELSKP